MKRAAIPSMHLYGVGGGARAVVWLAFALDNLGYQVDIFSRGGVGPQVRKWLPSSVGLAPYYPTCGRGRDLLLNIDHFNYAPPLAVQNIAHIFQPHAQNEPPAEYELWANSTYTAAQCKKRWGKDAKHIYIPIGTGFALLRKRKMILHCSRFVQPTEYADKAHRQMIAAFQRCIDSNLLHDWEFHLVGPIDPGMEEYFKNLVNSAQGYPIYFHVNVDDAEMQNLMGRTAIYWHMTGVSMKEIPGAQEHLGLTPLEAMASGAVPICYNSGGPMETINDGVSGFLVDDIGQLVRVTATLANDLTLWANASEQAMRAGVAWQDYLAFVDRVEAMLDGEVVPLPGPKPLLTMYQESDVTVIIPVYNHWDLTETMVRSIGETANPAKIIIVDNGSDEERPSDLEVEYVTHTKNLGYAGAVMSALDRVKTSLVLVANNDMECVAKGWLSVLTSYMEPHVGIAGPKLYFPDGRLQFAGGLIDWNRPDIGYHRYYGAADHPMANTVEQIPFVTGACLLARKELLEVPKELEKGLNYEDTHWCLNAWYRGYEVRYVPTSALVHYEASTKKVVPQSHKAILRNRNAFAKLWHAKWLGDPRLARLRTLNQALMGG